ncbi:hypothetical protein N7337_17675 [Comamonas aquatica]|jgi:hypothetical protein|uniref:hypothetical protein n=1 Tax=Comamonas aquatica TaxID=225991 RepID=UPI00244A44CA|nr:hypothetical protein [Comamonas aquatica]MDH0202697.1 hypothetical protein [Comamonas aquatica]
MAKPRRIKDKLLHEAYTPVESDADGYSDGADFAAVVGNKKFHSFQVWREKPSGKPTYVYGLTLKQIEDIRAKSDEKLVAENIELQSQLDAVRKSISELEQRAAAKGATLAEENAKLKAENQWYIHTLRPLLNRQPSDFVAGASQSVKATLIPTGGMRGFRRKSKRR